MQELHSPPRAPPDPHPTDGFKRRKYCAAATNRHQATWCAEPRAAGERRADVEGPRLHLPPGCPPASRRSARSLSCKRPGRGASQSPPPGLAGRGSRAADPSTGTAARGEGPAGVAAGAGAAPAALGQATQDAPERPGAPPRRAHRPSRARSLLPWGAAGRDRHHGSCRQSSQMDRRFAVRRHHARDDSCSPAGARSSSRSWMLVRPR